MSLAAAVAAAKGPPRFLDIRFDAQGAPVRCSGNTIVCHVAEGRSRDAITALQSRLAATEAGRSFAWLPASSLHMTVFDGVLHDRRAREVWPADLDPKASEAAADAFMAQRLTPVPAPQSPFEVSVAGAAGLEDGGGLGLSVSPVPKDEARLRAYRDRLADAAGLSHRPGHATYPFHITLAYVIGWASPAAAAEFDDVLEAGMADLHVEVPLIRLGPAQFCHFEDMTHFAPQG